MIDDPLSLLSLGIWLMAAGMWPVGFLFGACSACCDECLGSLCHFHEFSGFAFRPVILYPNVSITVSIDSASTNSIAFETNWIDIGTNNVSITGILGGVEYTATGVSYRYMLLQSGDGSCGLTDVTARYYIRFEASFSGPDFGDPLVFETPESLTEPFLIFESGECAPISLSDLEFSELPWSSLGTGETLEDNLVDYLSELVGTVSISFDACECGACCRGVVDAPAACLENVVSHLCDTDPSEQLWRGDGTTCEEEDCNSGACCDSNGNCYPVYSEDYCGGFFVPGVTCEDDPCEA